MAVVLIVGRVDGLTRGAAIVVRAINGIADHSLKGSRLRLRPAERAEPRRLATRRRRADSKVSGVIMASVLTATGVMADGAKAAGAMVIAGVASRSTVKASRIMARTIATAIGEVTGASVAGGTIAEIGPSFRGERCGARQGLASGSGRRSIQIRRLPSSAP
jgi:hypothetical protein